MSATTERLEPLFNQVLLKKLENEGTTKSGLLIVESKNNSSWRAEVLAVGPGAVDMDEFGERRRKVSDVKPGDVVYVPAFAGYKTILGLDEYLLVKDTEILCVVRRAS